VWVLPPELAAELPDRDIVLKKVRGTDLGSGLGLPGTRKPPTVARDEIIDIARSLARPAP
jgi:hypothetical protein